jgi:hypothetical protein
MSTRQSQPLRSAYSEVVEAVDLASCDNQPMPGPPEYLPDDVRAWAQRHQDVLELVASEFVRDGAWPTTAELTRRLARQGRPLALDSLLRGMPKPLGFVENAPGRIVLLLFGLRMTSSGLGLLDGFYAVLKRSLELYKGPGDPPKLSRGDVMQIPGDPAWHTALSEVVLREAPWLGGGMGGPEDDWRREIVPLIVHYWDIRTADDYLRIRAEELGASPQFGFAAKDKVATPTPPTEPAAVRTVATESERRDVFISHASEDKDTVAQPLAEELMARGLTVWFDQYELVLGDSLRRKIDEGLAQSRVGVVILSHAFFAKDWPQRELDGLTARLMAGESNVIVPIWHGLSATDLLKYSPPLLDLLAGKSHEGPVALATQVEQVIVRRARALSATPVPPAENTREPSNPDHADEAADPGGVHDATLDLLQGSQEIRLDQLMRGERHRFEIAIEAVTADHINHHLDEATLKDAAPRIASAVDRRLASLVPLAMYSPELLELELRAHARWASSVQPKGGGATWQEGWRLPFWVIGMTIGALSTRLERYPSLGGLLRTSWTNFRGETEPFVPVLLGETAESIATAYGPAPPVGQGWVSSAWMWLAAELSAKTWLADRYEDWLCRPDEPQDSLTAFDMIACIARGLRDGRREVGYWTIFSRKAEAFARRLHNEPETRRQLADEMGVSLDDFDARAPDALANVHALEPFGRQREIAHILSSGSTI